MAHSEPITILSIAHREAQRGLMHYGCTYDGHTYYGYTTYLLWLTARPSVAKQIAIPTMATLTTDYGSPRGRAWRST
eukprot:scaffold50367_cov57-Phaeocystis_antarctica.AAC.2